MPDINLVHINLYYNYFIYHILEGYNSIEKKRD